MTCGQSFPVNTRGADIDTFLALRVVSTPYIMKVLWVDCAFSEVFCCFCKSHLSLKSNDKTVGNKYWHFYPKNRNFSTGFLIHFIDSASRHYAWAHTRRRGLNWLHIIYRILYSWFYRVAMQASTSGIDNTTTGASMKAYGTALSRTCNICDCRVLVSSTECYTSSILFVYLHYGYVMFS